MRAVIVLAFPGLPLRFIRHSQSFPSSGFPYSVVYASDFHFPKTVISSGKRNYSDVLKISAQQFAISHAKQTCILQETAYGFHQPGSHAGQGISKQVFHVPWLNNQTRT